MRQAAILFAPGQAAQVPPRPGGFTGFFTERDGFFIDRISDLKSDFIGYHPILVEIEVEILNPNH